MRGIELFGCSGGMAEGFRRAGVEFLLAFDKDPDACASYTANLGRAPIMMDVEQLLTLVLAGGLRFKPDLDLLVADPPCVPWSRSGKRKGLADERDQMKTTCDLVRVLRPRAFLIGNVPGLEDATNTDAVQSTIGALADDGYCVLDSVVLDAADYGVPQRRIRPFWFGHRDGPCLRWPEPTHGDPRKPCLPGFLQLSPWITCREALRDISRKDLGRPVRLSVQTANHRGKRFSEPNGPARTATKNTHGDGSVLRLVDHHPVSELDSPARTQTGGSGTRGSGVLLTSADPVKLLEWPWERPSTTVTKENYITSPGHHPRSYRNRKDPNAVVLSEKARARLQGFPDDWQFIGKTKKSRSGQIGQAMPPGLAQAVALKIVQWFAANPAVSREDSDMAPRFGRCGECGSLTNIDLEACLECGTPRIDRATG